VLARQKQGHGAEGMEPGAWWKGEKLNFRVRLYFAVSWALE